MNYIYNRVELKFLLSKNETVEKKNQFDKRMGKSVTLMRNVTELVKRIKVAGSHNLF